MNFLITGAAGFLGSSLANQLSREGHLIRGLDDLSTGDPKALGPDVHFTRGDMSELPHYFEHLRHADAVIDLSRARLPARVTAAAATRLYAERQRATTSLLEALFALPESSNSMSNTRPAASPAPVQAVTAVGVTSPSDAPT